MRGILAIILSLACAGCAENRPPDPLSMNAGSYLTPSQVQHLKVLAKEGDAKAANCLADYYDEGLGDARESLKWLRLAAEAGDLEGEYNYAIVMVAVEQTPSAQTEADARKWIEKAAAGGYKPAIAKLVRLKRGESI
jgi:TPR repeat protein